MSGRLIDVREYPEFAAGHIAGSELVPLRKLGTSCEVWDRDGELVLVCKSGRRSEQARQELIARGFSRVRVLEGGVEQWSAEGNPLQSVERRPWSMERQVRAVAGSLILLTMLLAWGVSRWFLAGTAFVGAGLLFAGVSDICMMASLLGQLPWNKAGERCG